MGSLNYSELVKFSFSWASNRETIKYVLLLLAVSIIFLVLFVGPFLLVLAPFLAAGSVGLIYLLFSLLAIPLSLEIGGNELVSMALPAVIIFLAIPLAIKFVSVIVDLYISALVNFFAFRSAKITYPKFSLSRLGRFFILFLAEAFLVSFFWVHRKIWILGVAAVIGIILACLSIINPALLTVSFLIFWGIALVLIIAPLYLFFAGEHNSDAVGVNKYFLLFLPVLVVLILLSSLHWLFIILLAIVLVAYLVVIFYCSIRVFCSTPVFLSKGTGALDSIRTSLILTKGRVVDVFIAMLIWGLVSILLFVVPLTILDSILWYIHTPPSIGIFSVVVIPFVIGPLITLFGVFLKVGVYSQLLSKTKVKPTASKQVPKN